MALSPGLEALKAKLETIRSKSARAVDLIVLRDRITDTIQANGNEDATVEITPATKQAWKDKFDALVSDVKTEAATLP